MMAVAFFAFLSAVLVLILGYKPTLEHRSPPAGARWVSAGRAQAFGRAWTSSSDHTNVARSPGATGPA